MTNYIKYHLYIIKFRMLFIQSEYKINKNIHNSI